MEDEKVWLFIGQTIDKIKNDSTNTAWVEEYAIQLECVVESRKLSVKGILESNYNEHIKKILLSLCPIENVVNALIERENQ